MYGQRVNGWSFGELTEDCGDGCGEEPDEGQDQSRNRDDEDGFVPFVVLRLDVEGDAERGF